MILDLTQIQNTDQLSSLHCNFNNLTFTCPFKYKLLSIHAFSRCRLIEFNVISANFTLPEETKEGKDGEEGEKSPFKEIIFTELQREEAAKIVAEYNKVSAI